MTKTWKIAKFTLAFVIIAGGFSLIIGSLMGGGVSRGYDKIMGVNTDPRSILVQSVLIDAQSGALGSMDIPEPGSMLNESSFNKLVSQSNLLRSADGAHVRTPSILIQHKETGTLYVTHQDQRFFTVLSPSVIDTKYGPVLRIALSVHRSESEEGSDDYQEFEFSTAYTSAPGGAVVFDLADLGVPGSRAMLAVRTSLIDPTPNED